MESAGSSDPADDPHIGDGGATTPGPTSGGELPLAGLRVVDVAGRTAPHCGQLLALFGADVVVVHQPGEALDAPDWWAYNLGKRMRSCDVTSERGRTEIARLVDSADVLIEGDLALDDVVDRRSDGDSERELIHVVISPFGMTGPRRDWQSTELVAQAAGGILSLSGVADRPPAQVGFPLARSMVGAQAACAVMIAIERGDTGAARTVIDVSEQEAVANLLFTTQFMAWVAGRPSARGEQQLAIADGQMSRRVLWRCADGYVTWNLWTGPGMGEKNASMFEWMRERGVESADELLEVPWPTMSTNDLTSDLVQTVNDEVQAFLETLTEDEIRVESVRRRMLLYVIDDPAAVLANPQLRARDAFRPIPLGDRRVEIVAAPMRSTAYELDLAARSGAVRSPDAVGPEQWRSPRRERRTAARDAAPLAGIRVLDLGWAIVSPLVTRYLAMFGADVVKLEYRRRPDATRMTGPYPRGRPSMDGSAPFVSVNAAKRSIGIDLNHPRSRDVVLRLAARADIVSENFAPGVADRMGYGYEALRAVRPDVIALSVSMQGQTGPSAGQPGFGNHLQAMSGIDHLTGFPDGPPGGPNQVMPDFVGPWLPLVALLAALDHRRRTGEGQYLDVSQLEAMFLYMQPSLIEQQVAESPPGRIGNRHPRWSPHGVYPAAGDDQWIAIAVTGDDEWRRLHEMLPDGTQDVVQASAPTSERRDRADELDLVIAEWTRSQDADVLAERLQSLGIAASRVNDGAHVLADPQLAHREHYRPVVHDKLGDLFVEVPAFRLPGLVPRTDPGPVYADATVEVLEKWIGLDGDELAELVAEGALDF